MSARANRVTVNEVQSALRRPGWLEVVAVAGATLAASGFAAAFASMPPLERDIEYPANDEESPDQTDVHVYDVTDLIEAGLRGSRPLGRPELLFAPALSESRYEVGQGDSLGLIAARLLGSPSRWKQIAERNGIGDEEALHVGQMLVIPAWTRGDELRAGDRPSREEVFTSLVARLRDRLASRRVADSPASELVIQHLNNNLIVTATGREHTEIGAYLSDLRERRSIQVDIETQFLTDIGEWLADEGIHIPESRVGGPCGGVAVLTLAQAGHLLDMPEGFNQSVRLAAPRVRTFAGETASIQAATSAVVGLPDELRPGERVDVEIAEGVAVSVVPIVSDDLGSVAIELRPGYVELDRDNARVVEWRAEGVVHITLPDGGAAIVEITAVPFALVSAELVTGRPTGEAMTIVTRRRVEEAPRKLYVFVRPHIIIQLERETRLYPGLEEELGSR